jgi:EEF1A lysine methyltransferase 2
MMLIEFSNEGYTNLTGVDYSSIAVELASKVAKDQEQNISFKVADLLDVESVSKLGKFKIVHDKGTYDAIALMEGAKEKRATYIENVNSLMENDGLFIITSCNFTESELTEAFTAVLTKHAVIPTQVFMFGGKQGNIVTSLVFKKCV